MKDLDVQPPPPPKVVKVVRKTVLIRGKMKRQASKDEDILLNAAAETLAGLNNSAIPTDKGGDDSGAMSLSRESEELNNDLEAGTDHEADFSEMEDAAANEDEDCPMADPELVLLDMSKKKVRWKRRFVLQS